VGPGDETGGNDTGAGLIATIRAVHTAPDRAALAAALEAAIAPYGMTTYALAGLPAPEASLPTPAMLENWPETWARWYAERGYGPHDPVREAAELVSMPLTISQIRAGAHGRLPDEVGLSLLDAAAELDRGAGLLVPVRGAAGYRGMACVAGPGPEDPDPESCIALHMILLYAFDRLRALHAGADDAPGNPKLTQREIEVLRAARRGLDDEATAGFLGITSRTVRFHFENARRKMRCRTRAEAVARAVTLHLLEP